MAEAILRSLRPDLAVFSRGTFAETGSEMSKNAALILAIKGIPSSNHRSAPITKSDCRRADVILAMTDDHVQDIVAEFPFAKSKLSKLWGKNNIEDPAGSDIEAYMETADLITAAILKSKKIPAKSL